MKVRPAQPGDLDTLLTLRCALWPQRDISAHEQQLRRRFKNAARFVTMVLVNTDGHLCGFVELQRDAESCGKLNRVSLQALFVTPPMRRNGGAAQLLESAQRWAHAAGAVSLCCELSVDDEQARDAMQSLGFVEDGRWVSMSRPISAALEVASSPSSQPVLDQASPSRHTDDRSLVVIERARRPTALIVNSIVFIVAVVAFANTDIYSKSLLIGVVLPLLDVVFVLYFLFLFVVMRYRKRADSSARVDQLFRPDD